MQLSLGKGLSFLYVCVRLTNALSFNIDNKLSMDGQFAVALNSLGVFSFFPNEFRAATNELAAAERPLSSGLSPG
jgi:hypothetical protein